MINFEISKIENPTAIGLFNLTFVLAPFTMTKSAFTISLCRNVVFAIAFMALSGSAIRRTLTLFRTCSILLSNVALASSFARSDSKSDRAARGSHPPSLSKTQNSMDFRHLETVAFVQLEVPIMRNVLLLIEDVQNQFRRRAQRSTRVEQTHGERT